MTRFICSSILGDSLSYNDGHPFTTHDNDVDGCSCNCGIKDHGGWWYRNCAYVNLNGEYVTPGTKSSYYQGEGGVTHRKFDDYRSLKSTEMKFRRT